MSFNEPGFFFFFALVFVVHWSLRSLVGRKAFLLLASYAFYAAWDWRFLGLIVLSTLVDFVAAKGIVRAAGKGRAWLFLSLAVNLGMLGFFKYFHFFVDSAVELMGWLGLEGQRSSLEVVLPVGISFYTFQTLSYTLDVYRGRLKPVRSLLDLATFVAFFPQLVAGPIVRADEFLPQLASPRRLASIDVRGALVLFLLGFFKKACIADNLAPMVDAYFEAPAAFDSLTAWTGVMAYAVQIYCDFSGYSDMAIAAAALLGYRLVLNFNFPYLATSCADFWRRWHLSLSTWLRDYLYISLGGNRGGTWFTSRNLMLTMLLGGLWHGAAWTFVIWGALHGCGLILQRAWSAGGKRSLPAALGWLLTLGFICLTWIFFRAQSLESALQITRACLGLGAGGSGVLGRELLWFLPLFWLLHAAASKGLFSAWWRPLPVWGFGACYGLLWSLAAALQAMHSTAFIYFRF